jgi:hypothetical protein
MDAKEVGKLTTELKKRYPKAGIHSIEVDEKSGTSTFYLNPSERTLAHLEKSAVIPKPNRAAGSTVTRDALSRSYLDLGLDKEVYDEDPQKLFERAIQYYYAEPIVGSVINFLSSVAAKGFENDIDDQDIKNFYDTWAFDVNFEEVVEWIFLDFFKTSHVTTYKYIAKYEPRVSTLSPAPGQKPKKVKSTKNALEHKATAEDDKEDAAKKNIWSKGFLPIGYTVLNPLQVEIEGNLLFDKVAVTLDLPTELKDLLDKPTAEQTEEEKELIKALPPDLKNAAQSGEPMKLDSRLVGMVTYKKMPYERYAKPRIARVFDSIEYKKSLRQADLSTLDGITNHILKITIGNDEFPVTGQEELETVAALFDTPSKSFDVVWNHTLKIEKIVSPEIESILGKDKYAQVNDDITGGLSITRALIDGVGDLNQAEVEWSVRGIREDIEYARRQVSRWIYKEYRQIAEAMGFERFPKVRWDEGILKDEILYKNIISQMVDRRMLSYKTALEEVGFDYENEAANMEQELPLVLDGYFGIIGSPFQKSGGDNVQDGQGAPKGTPSNGRPPGNKKKKQPETDPNKQPDSKTKNPKKSASLKEALAKMSPEDRALIRQELDNI